MASGVGLEGGVSVEFEASHLGGEVIEKIVTNGFFYTLVGYGQDTSVLVVDEYSRINSVIGRVVDFGGIVWYFGVWDLGSVTCTF